MLQIFYKAICTQEHFLTSHDNFIQGLLLFDDTCFYNTFSVLMILLTFTGFYFIKTFHTFSILFTFCDVLFSSECLFTKLPNFPHTFFFCTFLVSKARVNIELSSLDGPSFQTDRPTSRVAFPHQMQLKCEFMGTLCKINRHSSL